MKTSITIITATLVVLLAATTMAQEAPAPLNKSIYPVSPGLTIPAFTFDTDNENWEETFAGRPSGFTYDTLFPNTPAIFDAGGGVPAGSLLQTAVDINQRAYWMGYLGGVAALGDLNGQTLRADIYSSANWRTVSMDNGVVGGDDGNVYLRWQIAVEDPSTPGSYAMYVSKRAYSYDLNANAGWGEMTIEVTEDNFFRWPVNNWAGGPGFEGVMAAYDGIGLYLASGSDNLSDYDGGGTTFDTASRLNHYGAYATSGTASWGLDNLRVEDNVSVSSAVDCVNDAGTCTDLTVTFDRTDTAASRGVSTTLQLSPELELCDTGNLPANFTMAGGAGAWADGYTNTTMQVYDNGGGNYTVDLAILGSPCGPTTGGDLFTIAVKPATGFTGEAVGTVSVTDVLVRDCANAPLPGVPGAAGEVAIDLVAPAALADLTATQVKTGNDSDGDTEITLSWTAPGGDADLIEIWRKGYGDYPEYDGGATPAGPVTVANGWTLVTTVAASDPPTYIDAPGSRDFWTYAAYVIDGCANTSPVSALTGGTLSYHLGDVTDGSINGNGDNLVTTNDMSHLGANYGISLVPNDALNYLDVGPTTDFSVDALPTTDDQVQFEDLMMFAINYNQVSKDLRAPQPAPVNAIELLAGEAVAVGGTFEVALRLQADGRLQGVSVPLTWDAAVVEPVGMRPGDLMAQQGGAVLVLSPEPGVVDAAVMGVRSQGISGDGVLAWVDFRVKASGEPRIGLGKVIARDADNQQVLIAGAAGVQTPTVAPEVSSLAPNAPNPFNPATELRFSVARDGQVQLRVYNLRGGLVRTLVNEPRAAGHHTVVWNGTDDAGRTVASGSYVVQLMAPDGADSRHITLVK